MSIINKIYPDETILENVDKDEAAKLWKKEKRKSSSQNNDGN
jgi:hypothetical protein